MCPVITIRPAAPVSLLVEAALLPPLTLSGRPPPGGSRSPPSSPTNTNLDQDLPMNPTLRSVSLPSSTNHTNHHKESVMNLFRSLALLTVLVLAPAGAFAATALNINITCTITASNAIEWTNPDLNANVIGQREWTITGATVNTAYASATQGTITGPAVGTPGITTQATALNFINRGNITITSSVTVANGTNGFGAAWNFGAGPAIDVFMLEASVDGGTTLLAPTVSGGALTLSATQQKNANCNLALRFTTPTSLSTGNKVTSSQVVTVLATQN